MKMGSADTNASQHGRDSQPPPPLRALREGPVRPWRGRRPRALRRRPPCPPRPGTAAPSPRRRRQPPSPPLVIVAMPRGGGRPRGRPGWRLMHLVVRTLEGFSFVFETGWLGVWFFLGLSQSQIDRSTVSRGGEGGIPPGGCGRRAEGNSVSPKGWAQSSGELVEPPPMPTFGCARDIYKFENKGGQPDAQGSGLGGEPSAAHPGPIETGLFRSGTLVMIPGATWCDTWHAITQRKNRPVVRRGVS